MDDASAKDSRRSLLLVDDDATFCRVLSRALGEQGFAVSVAHDAEQTLRLAKDNPPEYAVLDLKMPGASGLSLISDLKLLNETMRIVILTGYASISTAVEAIKLGAVHYLAKPAGSAEIVAALHRDSGDGSAPLSPQPLSVRRLEWEHIQKLLTDNRGNISATARTLGMRRSALQRKLKKRPVGA